MQGTQIRHIDTSTTRLNPDYAGNTFSGMWVPICNAAQPRLCGEYYPAVAVEGLTPAHAGNATAAPTAVSSDGVNPRTCGEHEFDGSLPLGLLDSPPHMRGTH